MKVSVIIPVYNASRFVQEAVESALSQPETAEVILIEDGSSDDSLKVCQGIDRKYRNVKLLRHLSGNNRGASASRNLGIQNVSSDYIAFLDADDWYLPGRFAVAIRLFERDAEIDGVYETMENVFENDTARREWFRRNNSRMTTLTERVPPNELLKTLLERGKGHFHLNCTVVRKRLLWRVGLFDQHLKLGEDTAMCVKMAAVGRLVPGRLKEPVAMRRIHGANLVLSPVYYQKRRHFHFLLWKTLFYWGVKNDLSPAKLDLLANAYLCDARRGSGDNRIYALWLLRLNTVGDILIKHPRAIKRRYFWNHVLRAMDLTKLKYLLTEVLQ